MRTTILSFQIYWLAVGFQSLKGEHYPKDAVICSYSQSSLTLRCGDYEVLRIHSATYAYIPQRYVCGESLISNIEPSKWECKQSSMLPRCHGEPVCTIEQREATQTLENCCFHDEGCYTTTNTLHVRYSCETVRKANSTVVVLPLLHGNVTGKALRVLSPYYPCNIPPSQPGNFSCKVAVTSAIPDTGLSVLLKRGIFIKFNPMEKMCEEKLIYAMSTNDRTYSTFCIHDSVTHWNVTKNYTVSPRADKLVEFMYSKFSAEGGKFVLDIEAFQLQRSLDLTISCTNQKDFTVMTTLPPSRITPSVLSPSLSHGCKPFAITPTSSSPRPSTSRPSKPPDVNQPDTSLPPHFSLPPHTTSLTDNPRPIDNIPPPDGSQSDTDVGDPSKESEAGDRKHSKHYMLIGIVVGVVGVTVGVTVSVIALCVAWKVR